MVDVKVTAKAIDEMSDAMGSFTELMRNTEISLTRRLEVLEAELLNRRAYELKLHAELERRLTAEAGMRAALDQANEALKNVTIRLDSLEATLSSASEEGREVKDDSTVVRPRAGDEEVRAAEVVRADEVAVADEFVIDEAFEVRRRPGVHDMNPEASGQLAINEAMQVRITALEEKMRGLLGALLLLTSSRQ